MSFFIRDKDRFPVTRSLDVDDAATAIATPGNAVSQAVVDPVAYQDFRDRADGSPTELDSGQPWQYTYGSGGTASKLKVVSGFLTNDVVSGATAGYAEVNLGAPVKRLGATVTFSAASVLTGAAAALVIWKTEHISGQVPDSGLHLTLSPERVQVQTVESTVFTTLGTTYFEPNLLRDGTTEYTVDAEIVGDTAYISVSNGSTLVVTDARIASLAGTWACWEVFATDAATQTKVRFSEIWADIKSRRVRAQAPSIFTATKMAEAAAYPVIAVSYANPTVSAHIAVGTTATNITQLTLTYVVPPSGKVLLEFTGYLTNPASTTVLLAFGPTGLVVATGVYDGPITARLVVADTPGARVVKAVSIRRIGGTDASLKNSETGGYFMTSSVTALPS